jgi:alkanesulfonate monooxygenase SsuD/methylene tetrahydromethanopterin reductase-like flavin-dependent oxidoreductase (luciferase family)
VRIGTLMLSLPIRDNPAVLAKEVIALDHLSDGRLEFGFGAGILEGDHAGAGHEFWAKEERVARWTRSSLLRRARPRHQGRRRRGRRAPLRSSVPRVARGRELHPGHRLLDEPSPEGSVLAPPR